jgi:hypothetical protein
MSQMIEVKTADLIGPALDWAVGEVHGEWAEEPYHLRDSDGLIWCNNHSYGYSPSADWAQGGPLIEKYGILFLIEQGFDEPNCFVAILSEREAVCRGETHLIAACRAIVAAKLGDVVSVPAELVGGEK